MRYLITFGKRSVDDNRPEARRKLWPRLKSGVVAFLLLAFVIGVFIAAFALGLLIAAVVIAFVIGALFFEVFSRVRQRRER